MTNSSFNEPPFSDAEQAQLHHALQDVELPGDLLARLQQIPGKVGEGPARRSWMKIAAMIAVVAGLSFAGYAAWSGVSMRQQAAHLQTLTAQAVEIHEGAPAPAIALSDPDQLAKALRESSGASATDIRADVYPPADGTTLLGGGTVTLNGKALFFTRYAREGKTYTLYQMSLAAFDLPRALARARSMTHDKAGRAVALETWPDATASCGWLLVSADADALPAHQLLKAPATW